jgi:hypothetical protein
MKARIPDARVASTGDDSWTIRFKSPSHLKTIREMLKTLGLKELYHDVEGSRWDWGYVFHVVLHEELP